MPCRSPATASPACRPAGRCAARRLAWSLPAAALLAGSARAEPVDARVLDATEAAVASDVAWLVDRRVLSLPLGTWPLPAATLRRALAARDPAPLPAADAAALQRLRAALARLDEPAAVAFRFNTARHPALDGADAARGRADLRVTLQPAAQPVAMRLRLGVEDDPLARRRSSVSLAGSYVAVPLAGNLVSFGRLDRHWGPGVWSGTLLSHAAPPPPALIVRRLHDEAFALPLLEHLGPWGYEFSVAQLLDYRPRGAQLLGLRLHLRPAPWIEIGVSRHIFWGGEGRPHGARALARALLGRSNIDGENKSGDPSNELAGADLRLSWRLGDAAAASAHAQVVGEDEAGGLPSHLIGLVGLQLANAFGEQRLAWTLEAVDTETSRLFGLGGNRHGPAYGHAIYRDGYYHLGLPLGARIGGGGHSLSLGLAWMAPAGGALDRVAFVATAGRVSGHGAEPLNLAFGTPGRLHAASLRAEGALGTARWRLGLSLQHTPSTRREAGLVGAVEWPFGAR